jgi:molybdenum cofactor guanylyltransferase
MGSGIVLAGGRGTRLGGEKAGALLDGRPLVEHVIGAIRAAALEPLVVAKADTPLPPLDCPLVIEPDLPRHPLCGVIAGLRAIGAADAIVCPTDMPRVSGELLRWLFELPDALALVADQPLLGRYSATLLPALEAILPLELPMREVGRRLGARIVSEAELRRFGDPARLLLNVNTAAELARAEG